jgi:putative transposase
VELHITLSLAAETPAGNLSQIMHHINGAYTTYFNVKRTRSGHLFQGRYKAILVEKDEYAKELSRYIHLNPIREKMVETPDRYEWPSYHFYVGNKECPEWLQRRFILGYFGRRLSVAQKGYKRFVLQLVDQEYENPLKDVLGSALLGSREFVDFVKDYISGRKAERGVPSIRQLTDRISIRNINETVDLKLGGDPRFARKVKIFLCRKLTAESLKKVGEQFGIGDSAVSQSYSRFPSVIETDRRVRSRVAKIEKTILCNVEP